MRAQTLAKRLPQMRQKIMRGKIFRAHSRGLSVAFFTAIFAARLAHADIVDITPAAACNYLATIGLRTTTYRQQADGVYRCASPAIDIGANNIAYSVAGGEKAVAEIKLVINVYNAGEAVAIHRRLKDVANTLAQKLSAELPDAFQKDLTTGTGAEVIANNRRVSIVRVGQPNGSYTVTVQFK